MTVKAFQQILLPNDPGAPFEASTKNYDDNTFATITNLALKAPLSAPTFTGLVTCTRLVKTPQTVSYAATVTIDASTGDSFAITATGDMHLAAPTNPTNGQMLVVEVLASGANRAVTIDGPILLTTGLVQNTTIISGQVGVIAMRYSALRGNVWMLTAITQG